MSEIKKKYNHFSIESEFLKKNYFQKLFKSGIKRDKITAQFPIGISKDTTLASIQHLIQEDILNKYRTQKGIKAKLLPIFDTETKNIKTETYENLITKAGIFFGIDTDNIVYSERNTNFVRNVFVDLVQKRQIYEDFSINYRSMEEQKTLGVDEITYKTSKVKEYHIRYFVDTKNISLVVPTIRPETIFADVALAVHPDDRRYKKLVGSKVIIPIINKTIPIIKDESVDPTKGTGIIRITPAHDQLGLAIAQKNGMEINKFAIDKSGCFTKQAGDFCGKNIKEFIKNIIKNLDDIHNLESTHQSEVKIAVHKKTGEKARPILCNQLFISTASEIEKLETAIQESQIKVIPEEYIQNIKETIPSIGSRPVTKEDSKGYCLPLWKDSKGKNYFFSDNEFLNLPSKKTKNKLTVLSLIIFNLIVDQRLDSHFSIESCIDVLVSQSRTGGESTLQTYIELFSETLPRGYTKEIAELKKIFEYTEKTPQNNKEQGIKSFEKFSIALSDMLEKSIAISSKKKGEYIFDIDTLTNGGEGLIQQKEKIEETLGNALILIKIMEAFESGKKQAEKIFYTSEGKIAELSKTLLLGYAIQDKKMFDSCYVYSQKQEISKNTNNFKEMIKNYGTDCIRLYATNTSENISVYEQFIAKLRNASRFVHQHAYTKKGSRKISDFTQLTNYLKKNQETGEFESRIIHKISELQKEYQEKMEKNDLIGAQTAVIHSIKENFCEKYLEIYKNNDTVQGDKITIRCLGTLLQLLHPFAPFITQQIRNMIGLEGSILTQTRQEDSFSMQKNYKTQLFMDIIDKGVELRNTYKYAKHQKIDVGFFAPLDFLQYLRKHEKTIYGLLNVAEIIYLENERELKTYHTESIINITIGIKDGSDKQNDRAKKISLADELYIKEQKLQQIRTIVSGLNINDADPEIIKQKKKEMNKLKKEIEDIQLDIQKQKLGK